MKSKTLLIAAAALAVGVISSQAQTAVYSQNIVGYVNVPLPQGYVAIANQLDYDGTGTNNNVNTVFGTNLVAGTSVQVWLPGAGNFASATWIKGKSGLTWTGDTNDVNAALNVGGGVFIGSPSTNNITLVGNVIQGTNIVHLTPGYNLVSSIAPISGSIDTNLSYVPSVGDQIQVWSTAAQSYNSYSFIKGKSGNTWSPSDPQIPVGASIFLNTTNTAWVNTFSVQ